MNIRLIILFCIIPTAHLAGMEVTFFNVGQGNCTLVTYPGQKTMLVDAGSSSAPLDDAKCVSAISSLTNKIIAKSPDKKLFVVVSHADKDHINKITSVCRQLLNKEFSVSYLLGGSKDNYEATVQGKQLLDFIDSNSQKCSLKFAAEIKEAGTQRYKELKKIVPNYCTVLSALIDQKDGNNNSLVLKVSDENLSTILPGDATGDATDEILNDITRRHLMRADVFEISHHGADTHNCTSEQLLIAINPQQIIISSGLMYEHPRFEVLKTLVTYCTKKKLTRAPHHMLTYQHSGQVIPYKWKTDDNRLEPVAINQNGFCTAQTSYPIYNTVDAGTITYNQNGITVGNTKSSHEERGLGALHGIQTALFNGIRLLLFNNREIKSAQFKKHFTTLPNALEYFDLRNNKIGHLGIEHLIKLCKNHKQNLLVKLSDNHEVDKATLITMCEKKENQAITSNNRVRLTFSKKGKAKDTIESLEFSPGKSSTPPFQDAHAKAYAANHSPKSRAAQKNLFTLTHKKNKEITGGLSHDEENLYVEYANQQDKNIGFIWPDITDICVLSDKNQTVAGVTTKERSWLFDFVNNDSKDLIGKFRYTNTGKPWKTIGKEFWSLNTPGISYYHERTPFSQNGKFVLTVSAKNKCINVYQTDRLIFDPQHVKLHKSISEDELKNDLGHSIKDIKRIEFCDADHSIKCHFTDKTSGELRYILEPNEI